MNILFVTADMAVHAADMYNAGKSGGCGYPVATQWRVRDARPATTEELADHEALVASLKAAVFERRYWYRKPTGEPGEWAIKADVPVYARLGYVVSGQQEWGRTHFEFDGMTTAA